MALTVGDPEHVPDDLFEVVRVRHREDQHAAGLEHPMNLAERAVGVRDVLQHFDAEHEVVCAIRERDAVRDVLDQHVRAGELGSDVDPLVFHPRGQEAAQPGVAGADVQHGGARGDTGEPGRLAEPHPLLARRAPGGAGGVERGELAGGGGDLRCHK